MATFRKRGKKWEYRIRYTDPLTGKKAEHSKGGFDTKPEAEYAAAEAYIDVKDGVVAKKPNILLKDYADVWFDTYKASVKETSLRSRKTYLKTIKDTFKELRLNKLTHNLYQKKLNELAEKYKYNSLLSINQIAQMIAKKAVKDGYFKSNPIADAKIPHYENGDDKLDYWEMVDIQKFTNHFQIEINKKRKISSRYITLEKERDLTLFFLLIYGGFRIGEVCALNLHDFYPITHEVDISKTLGSPASNQTKSSYKIYPPKTKSAYRTIPLPEIAYKQLEKWIYLRKEYVSLFPSVFHESQFLFCKKDGSPIIPRDARTKFDAVIRKVNLPRINLHGLRHTYAALQIQAGIDPKSLQMLLGHASIKTTLDIYAHITGDKRRETIDKFDQMLKNFDSGAKAGQNQKPEISKT